MTKDKLPMNYLVLLRGINVGGNNIIKMNDLKNCFENMGFQNVQTFIQSGNILFFSNEKNKAKLSALIEAKLSQTFNYEAKVVIITDRELKDIVNKAPHGFGSEPSLFRYDVIFIKEPLTAAVVMKIVRTKVGVDTAFAGKYVLYFSRLIEKAAQSHLSKIISLPEYKFMTIRNWNTTTRLVKLMKG